MNLEFRSDYLIENADWGLGYLYETCDDSTSEILWKMIHSH